MSSTDLVTFTAPLRMWSTERLSNLGYVLLEGDVAEAIRGHELMRKFELGRGRGFGSVKVNARVGDRSWSTSAFPTREGGWFLPIKKAICRAEELEEGDEIEVRLELL